MLTNEGNFPLILILFPFHLLQAIIVINGLRTRYPCSSQPAAAAAAAIGAAEWDFIEVPRKIINMASSMYKLVQTINSTKFRIEPFEDYYDVFEEIGRWESPIGMSLRFTISPFGHDQCAGHTMGSKAFGISMGHNIFLSFLTKESQKKSKYMLKTVSDKIIYRLGRYSFFFEALSTYLHGEI